MVFAAVDIGKTVAELTGLVESVEKKIDRLGKSELGAGLSSLRQARRATGERQSLLREARSRFNKATELETGLRQIVAFFALATTHLHLGDEPNAREALKAALAINPVTRWQLTKAAMMDATSPHVQDTREIAKELTHSPTERKSLATWKELVKSSAKVYADTALGVPTLRLAGKLLKSKRENTGYKGKLVQNALEDNEEARLALELQQEIARYLDEPIVWLETLTD